MILNAQKRLRRLGGFCSGLMVGRKTSKGPIQFAQAESVRVISNAHTPFLIPTSSVNTCQCRGCERCRPAGSQLRKASSLLGAGRSSPQGNAQGVGAISTVPLLQRLFARKKFFNFVIVRFLRRFNFVVEIFGIIFHVSSAC